MTVAAYRATGRRRALRCISATGAPTPTPWTPTRGRELWVRTARRRIPTPPSPARRRFTAIAYMCRRQRPAKRCAADVPIMACCTFRGSVSALDATTGEVVWKSYSITEAPKPRAREQGGVQLFGPAGAAIWGSPTIDREARCALRRHGQRLRRSAAADDGCGARVRSCRPAGFAGSRQTVPNDVWIWQCPPTSAGNANCPADAGPRLRHFRLAGARIDAAGTRVAHRRAEVGCRLRARSRQGRGECLGISRR